MYWYGEAATSSARLYYEGPFGGNEAKLDAVAKKASSTVITVWCSSLSSSWVVRLTATLQMSRKLSNAGAQPSEVLADAGPNQTGKMVNTTIV